MAFDRSGQRLVDWECGDAATLNRLLERLKPWSVTLYCTDDYAPYDTLLPVGRHYIGKDETVAIERVNSRLRHWFARFRPAWCRKRSRWSMPPSRCLPPTTLIEQRQNSPCHCLLNTLSMPMPPKSSRGRRTRSASVLTAAAARRWCTTSFTQTESCLPFAVLWKGAVECPSRWPGRRCD